MVQLSRTANPATAALSTSRTVRILIAIAVMALAANCFLKYLWWTACYSAWSGIPRMAEQWRAAGANAAFNGWSVVVLVGVSLALVFSVIQLRTSQMSGLLKTGVRIAISLATTIIGTAIFTLVLSWFKQGIH